MTSIRTFLIGALVGTLFGAIFLGALSHLLLIALVAAAGGGAALERGRRRLSGRRVGSGLSLPPKTDA
jgi:hypothetical protein